MAAQTGRTIESVYTQFWLDNSSGTLTNLSAYASSVGAVGLDSKTVDVTAYSDAVYNYLVDKPTAPITVTFPLDTVVITHLSALNRNTPLSLGIYYGVRQAWQSGEPTFGISSSSTSGYVFMGFKVSGGVITANFDVFGPTAPAWGTAAVT
jgi:hypothetical protein